MTNKVEIISDIIERELNMFINVRSRYPVSCQENPQSFRLHRDSQFAIWSEETLLSYRNDLIEAAAQGNNLMTLKYARMEGIIPPLKKNPMIDKIVQTGVESQKAILKKYTNVFSNPRPITDDGGGTTSFSTYLKSELETYSDQTLCLLQRDILMCKKTGQSWSEETYLRLVQKLGFESLDKIQKVALNKKK